MYPNSIGRGRHPMADDSNPAPARLEGVQAKRSTLTQAAGAPQVGRREAPAPTRDPARTRRIVVGLLLSVVVVVAVLGLVMGLAADISR